MRATRPQPRRAFPRSLISAVGLLVLWLSATGAWLDEPSIPPGNTPKEIELGKQGAADVARQFKILKDHPELPRLRAMVAEIAAVSPRPQIDYRVFVIKQDDVINAFTIPGGYVYVTTGLLNAVQSEHELAAVVAHEIAHNARMHALRKLAKARKLQPWQLLAIIGAASTGVGELAIAAQLITTAVLNGYGVEAESEADAEAVRYLMKTRYNPVGVLTFMERMATSEMQHPGVDPGIYRTHPPSPQRAKAITALLQKNHIPLVRRAVTHALLAFAANDPDSPELWHVVMMDRRVMTFATKDAPQRARQSADTINRLLDDGLKMFHLRVRGSDKGPSVVARGRVIATVAAADAAVADELAEELASEWVEHLKEALWAHDPSRSSMLKEHQHDH